MPSPWTKANDVWVDAPSTATPLIAAKIQHIDDGVYDLKQLTWKLTYDEPTNIITMAGGLRANSYYVSGTLLASTHLSDGATLVKTGDTGTVSNAMLANSSVTGAKIQSSATLPGTPLITTDPAGTDQTLKIASTQWVRAAIATYAPGGGGGTIADNSIANVKLFDKTVTNAKIADGTIIQSLFPATMIDGSAAVASIRTLGTGAAQAAAGNDSRLSDTRTPTALSVVDASVSASAAITWTKISKTGSSLADFTTRSAADLSSGLLPDARLSSNVPLLSAANTFAGNPQILGGTASFRFRVAPSTDRIVWGMNTAAFVSSAGHKRMLMMALDTDTQPVIGIQADGTPAIVLGAGGSTAPDVNLYRSAVNVLKTDDTFDAVGYQVAGVALAASHLSNGVSGTGAVVLASALSAYAPLASPALTGTPTAPTPSTADNTTKIATTAYVKAQSFSTPDPLVLTSDVTARNALATQTKIGAVGPTSQAGILFGTDTNLYRSAASTVKTDGGLEIVGSVGAGSLFSRDSIGVNQSDLTPGGGQGAIFFGGGWDTHISRRTGGAVSPWLFINRAVNAPDFIGGENPAFDIRWFGAIPTDAHQTTAIVAAVAAAKAKGGCVYLPPGVQWKVNASVTIPSSVAIIGQKGGTSSQSRGSVITQAAGYTGSIFTLSDVTGYPDFIDFRDINIFNQGGANGHGIYVPTGQQATHVNFDRVMFTNFTTGGGNSIRIDPGTAGGTGTERWYWTKCTFLGGGINDHHVYVTGTFFDKSSFNQCVWRDFMSYAVVINTNYVRTFGMQNCVVDGAGGAGSQCRGSLWCSAEAKGINVNGHYSENCGNRGTTALITVEGDFVFSTSAYLMGHISGGYLNDGGGSTTMNVINIPNSPGGNIVAAGVFKVNGLINDPGSKLVKSACNF